MVVVYMSKETSKWLWSEWVRRHPCGCGLHGYRDIQVVVVGMGTGDIQVVVVGMGTGHFQVVVVCTGTDLFL